MPLSYSTPLVLTDPGFLLWAPLASTLPSMVAAGSTYTADAWPVAWIPLGATEDGSEFNYETKIEAVKVAEYFDPIKWSTTDRSGSFAFNLANWTLNNVKRAYNGGTLTTVSGSGATLSSKYTLPAPGQEVRAMLGWESLDGSVRIVCYQTINSGSIKQAYKRAPAFAVLPCQFSFEIPTSGVQQPFEVWAAGTGRLGT